MNGAEKKSGRRREREREMDARTRPLGSRASTSLSLLFSPSLPVLRHSLPASPSIRALWYPFCFRPRYFSCLRPPRFLARDAAIRQFFLITCSLKSALIAHDSFPGTFFNSPSISSVRTGIFLYLEMSILIYLNANLVAFDIIYYRQSKCYLFHFYVLLEFINFK